MATNQGRFYQNQQRESNSSEDVESFPENFVEDAMHGIDKESESGLMPSIAGEVLGHFTSSLDFADAFLKDQRNEEPCDYSNDATLNTINNAAVVALPAPLVRSPSSDWAPEETAPVASNANLPQRTNYNGFVPKKGVKGLKKYPRVFTGPGGRGKMRVITCGGKHSNNHTGRDCMRQCIADDEAELECEMRPAPLSEGETRHVCHAQECTDGNREGYPSFYKFKAKKTGRLSKYTAAMYLCSVCPDAPAVLGQVSTLAASIFWARHVRSFHGAPDH